MLEPLAPDTLEKLKGVSTATLTMQLIKIAGLRSRSPLGVRPLNPACCHFVAEAATLRYAPMREDLDGRASTALPDNPTRLAVETTPPGHVLMIDQAGRQGGGTGSDGCLSLTNGFSLPFMGREDRAAVRVGESSGKPRPAPPPPWRTILGTSPP